MRRIHVGLMLAAVYVMVAAVSFDAGLFPARPLYDGTAPPEPYRWVDPPRDLASTNQPPASLREQLTAVEAKEGADLNTDDRQAFVLIGPDALVVPDGISGVDVVIEPLDPDQFGDAPEGLDYDGNAYRIEARYQPSGEVADLAQPVTVLLRYPFGATSLLRRDGDTWTELESSPSSAFELFSDTDRFGVFVAAGLPRHVGSTGIPEWVFAVAGLLVVVGGVALGRVRSRQRRDEEVRRQMGKKAKKPPPGHAKKG